VICRPDPAFAEASLSTGSLISAVLTEAAIRDHHDALRGLKQTRHRQPPDLRRYRPAFHRAKKEREAWEVEERAALLQQEKANMASEPQRWKSAPRLQPSG
jgi:DNA-directed RNA polymerase subunit beta'